LLLNTGQDDGSRRVGRKEGGIRVLYKTYNRVIKKDTIQVTSTNAMAGAAVTLISTGERESTTRKRRAKQRRQKGVKRASSKISTVIP